MASRFTSLARPSLVRASLRAFRSSQKLGSCSGVQQVRWQSSEVSSASAELVDVLNKELDGEKQTFEGAPAVPAGWSLKNETAYQFTMEKTEGNMTVSIDVDINNLEEIDSSRLDDEELGQEGPVDGEGPQYLPNFTITIANTNAPNNARFFCSFDEGAEGDMVFTVTEMCLFKPGTEEQVMERKVYHCNAAVLDSDMYDGLMKFLESLGIDPNFLEFLIGQTQSYEQGKYIDFLQGAVCTFKA